MKRINWMILPLVMALALSGCTNTTPTTVPSVIPPGALLTPYVTITLTPTATSTPIDAPTATPAPTLSPTPRLYTVKAKDTLQVIAFRNGLTVEELKAANPDVNAYLLIVGSTLVLPPSSSASGTPQAQEETPTTLTVGAAYCSPTATGGAYCFATVTNEQPFEVANVSAEFRLTNLATGDVLTKPATLPVSRVKEASSLPLFAYFQPPVFANPQVTLHLQSAIQAGVVSTAPVVTAAEPLIQINPDGGSAKVSGAAAVDAASTDASKVWISAVAFDVQGNVVGMRRWESPGPVKKGEPAAFEMWVYSSGGTIATVELFIEANS